MAAEPDLYAVLGVSPDSEDIVIQAAYRALMRRYHPDKNTSEEARQRSVRINAAYDILGDAAKRAAYDSHRSKHQRSKTGPDARRQSSSAPPPPPPPRQTDKPASAPINRNSETGTLRGVITVFFVLVGIIIFISSQASNITNLKSGGSSGADNLIESDIDSMSLDANMAMDAIGPSEIDANMVMNGEVANGSVNGTNLAETAIPASLSNQPQTAVSYSTIEGAANRFAKILVTKGILGARAVSEHCHKAVESAPDWDSADRCAAFDYAAAYMDEAVARSNGGPKDGYFQFQRANQSDNYQAVGAASWTTSSRLSKIRQAAEAAGADAVRIWIARQSTIERMQADEPTNSDAEAESVPG